MKLSRFKTLGSVAWLTSIAGALGLLGGCASTPVGPSEAAFDIGNKPQMLIQGAVRSDVKGLAMGAARSKGWTIVKSTEDRLVVQRPVDASAASAPGVHASTIPPVVEVTSAFVQRPDGVLVGLGAELISQPSGEKAPKRQDYTETYRDALTRSLESLRSNWAANHQRVASSTPSDAVRAEAEAERAEAGAASSNPLVQVWADALQEEKASKAKTSGSSTVAASTRPPAAPSASAPEPRISAPAAETRPTPSATIGVAPAPVTSSPSAPPPARTAGAAPVVDGSIALRGGGSGVEPARITATPLPGVQTEPVPPDQNMLTLSEATGTGTWAYYAEQYARLRGCEVADQGAILVESRADSEILKVPCRSADSFLVKCQSGVCRGLE